MKVSNENLKVGDIIRFKDSIVPTLCAKFDEETEAVLKDITPGKLYAIVGIDVDGDSYFIDNQAEEDYATGWTQHYDVVQRVGA